MSDIWHDSTQYNKIRIIAEEKYKNKKSKMTIEEFKEKMKRIEKVFFKNASN